jgi:hypothetical protein
MLGTVLSVLHIRLAPESTINKPKERIMKRLLVSAMLLLPVSAFADHMDGIEFTVREGCSFSKYLQIVKEFNEQVKDYGYETEIAVPLQSNNLWTGGSEFHIGEIAGAIHDVRGQRQPTWLRHLLIHA